MRSFLADVVLPLLAVLIGVGGLSMGILWGVSWWSERKR